MDIFQLLRKDHGEALMALTEWVRRPEGPHGLEAWARWSERWEVHVRIEENFLFPFLKDDPLLRGRLAEAVGAHARIRKCLQEMPPYAGDADAWVEAVSDLLESLESLLEMEERVLFPMARAFLPREEAEDLGREVQDFLRGLQTALAAGR
ncbi:MAG: hemerythrin [Fibrobacteres bacterium]|nr:hemerythrin [Fibrobacterota bacterium]